MRHFTSMNNRLACLGLLLSLVLGTGCSGNVHVHGKVAFDDGSPLTLGTVVFDDGQISARGKLDENGSFRIGSKKADDGLPPGNYKVYIIGALKGGYTSPVGNIEQSAAFGQVPVGKKQDRSSQVQFLVHTKYGNRNTTDLSCEVTSSTREVNFTVERPGQGK